MTESENAAFSPEGKTVFIHVGPPKTGTTTIQAYLRDHHDFLATKNTWTMPHKGLLFGHNLNDTEYWQSAFMDLEENGLPMGERSYCFSPRLFAQNKALCRAHIQQGIEQQQNIVLSSEALWRAGPVVSERIADYFRSYGYKVRFIIYMRSPLQATLSWISQRATVGFMSKRSVGSAHAMIRLTRVWLTDMQARFGPDELDIRRFDQACFPQGNLISDFLSAIGLSDVACPAENQKRNIGAGQLCTHVGLEVNARLMRQYKNSHIGLHFKPHQLRKHLAELEVGPYRPSDEVIRSLYNSSGEDIDLLRELTGFTDIYDHETILETALQMPQVDVSDEDIMRLSDEILNSAVRQEEEEVVAQLNKAPVAEAQDYFLAALPLVHSLRLARSIRDKAVDEGLGDIAEIYARLALLMTTEVFRRDIAVYSMIILNRNSFFDQTDQVVRDLVARINDSEKSRENIFNRLKRESSDLTL
ncbi:hypothetical protein [Halocynthiibacter styelae]|uniref:Sulfotransferase domain-containing protein n=1 Tax=Halocynthiibacter styelae TaxID=2761955 RepID=A0A8J7LR22_9RHOB|nr:hypothetical protein [Paenihalocynthiibacter styelae]MBI1495077.1 hypothetical protein [Paenihalocynthiibacter styelae]